MKLAKPLPRHESGNNGFRLSSLFRYNSGRRKAEFDADNSKSSKALVQFQEDIQTKLNSFHLTILSSSSPYPPSSLLTWPWLHSSLAFLSDKHIQALELSGLDPSLSESDEKQTRQYLNHSTEIIELCNAITAAISHLQCSLLYLRYALSLLENHTAAIANNTASSGDFSKVKEALSSYRSSVHNRSVKARNVGTLLRELSDNNSLKFNNLKKKRMNVWYHVHSLLLLTFASIALSLIPQEKGITTAAAAATETDLTEPPRRELSIHYLLRLAKEERESKTSVLGLSEFTTLDDSVDELLDSLNSIYPARLTELTQDLKQQLGSISSNLEEVGKKISDYFHLIIHSRSVLVEAMGNIGNTQRTLRN